MIQSSVFNQFQWQQTNVNFCEFGRKFYVISTTETLEMTNIRPMTQAKYQLLLESRRTLLHAKWPIIIMTTLALGLIAGSLLVAFQLSRNIHFKSWYELTDNASYHMKRAEFYSMATVHQAAISSEPIITSALPKDKNQSSFPANHHLVCYYAIHDNVNGSSIQPEDIDPYLCTHIIIAFAHIANCTLQPLQPGDIEIYHRVVGLKKINPALKVMLSVGQMTADKGFYELVDSESSRKSFAKQAAEMLSMLHLDGLDLDWEFPDWPPPGQEGRERRAFSSLLSILHRHFTAHSKRRLLLSVAVAAPKTIVDVSYDVPLMAKLVDFINLMTYDFHYYVWYLPMTGHNAPLYPRHSEHGFFSTMNTNWSATYWVQQGMPRHKIQIGIPTYAHTFMLINPDNHGLGAPTIGFGSIGQQGFAYYSDVCEFLERPNAHMQWDDESKVPFAYEGFDWISYDNEDSVEEKARLVRRRNYGGAMVWSLCHDDFLGRCGRGKFPLIQHIQQTLGISNRRSADFSL